jgi:hypothetical protein
MHEYSVAMLLCINTANDVYSLRVSYIRLVKTYVDYGEMTTYTAYGLRKLYTLGMCIQIRTDVLS